MWVYNSHSTQTKPGIAVRLSGVAALIETWGGQVQGQAANAYAGYLRVTLPADRLSDLAALDDVLWVEPYVEPKLNNDVGSGTIMRADTIRRAAGRLWPWATAVWIPAIRAPASLLSVAGRLPYISRSRREGQGALQILTEDFLTRVADRQLVV